MPIRISRGSAKNDPELKAVQAALKNYLVSYSKADVSLYRRGEYLIRIRVINPSFKGLSIEARQRTVWNELRSLPEEIFGDISQLLVLTPDEVKTSFGNMEFEHPVPLAGIGVD